MTVVGHGFTPTSAYAASKASADHLCHPYQLAHDLPIFRLRIFGTTGVGMEGDFCNDIAGRVAAAERNGGGGIRVGRLNVRREIMDVEDYVRAAEAVALRGERGKVYNVGAGQAYEIGELLKEFFRLESVPLTVEADPSLLRTADEPVHLGDTTRLRALGWSPSIPIQVSLKRILDGSRNGSEPSGLGLPPRPESTTPAAPVSGGRPPDS